jgi:ankyrin repeat protein
MFKQTFLPLTTTAITTPVDTQHASSINVTTESIFLPNSRGATSTNTHSLSAPLPLASMFINSPPIEISSVLTGYQEASLYRPASVTPGLSLPTTVAAKTPLPSSSLFLSSPAGCTKEISINQQDKQGNTALMNAILQRDIARAFSLLSPALNPNLQNNEGDTALILALKLGYIHLARAIVHHPSINILAINKRQENVFAYLDKLDFHSENIYIGREIYTIFAKQMPSKSINIVGRNSTPLCIAASTSNLQAMQILLQRGADPNLSDHEGNTPLMLAIKQGHAAEIAELISITQNINQQNQEKDTALMIAIRLGCLPVAKALIQSQQSLNIFLKNNQQESAFSLLAHLGYFLTYQHLSLAKTMLIAAEQYYPFDIDSTVDGSNTLLGLAAQLGEIEVLKKLLAKGARPTVPDRSGNTPLMLAIQQAHLFAANLLSTVSNANQQNQAGDTALMLAIRSKQIQTARILTNNTSQLNVFLTNLRGETALSLFFSTKMAYTPQNLLLAHRLLFWAGQTVPIEQIDEKVDGTNTLLCLAVILADLFTIDHLLVKGASLNVPDKEGNTPFMLAIIHRQSEMMQILLTRHPDLTLKNHQGKTAHIVALENGWSCDVKY